MWKQLSLAALVALAAQQQTQAAVVFFEEEAGENVPASGSSPSRVASCDAQVAMVCGQHNLVNENLLFGGVANKMKCLTEHQNDLSGECFMREMDAIIDSMLDDKKKDQKCHDELRSKCGKQIDQLKRAIQDTSVIGTVKGAVDVLECVVTHAEDLWKKCKPFEGPRAEDCVERAAAICPMQDTTVLGAAKSLECLAGHVDIIGTECVTQQVTVVMENMEASSAGACHDELRKQCGKQIDKLKKEIEATSIVGILKGSVDVAQCVAQNARSLWQKCKPFEAAEVEVDECTKKIAEVCPAIGNNVLGLTTTLTCLTEKAQEIGEDCAARQIEVVAKSLEKDSKCHDAVRSKCGKQMDKLNKDVENMDIGAIIKDAADVASCLIDNAADIWAKCKPFMPMEETAEEAEEEPLNDCAAKVAVMCPPSSNKVMGLGYSLGCLAQHATELGVECIQQEMLESVEAAEEVALSSDDKSCHDELRKRCGKQIDELKKEIQHTSIIGIVKGAVDVVACVAENAENLWNKCKPFTEQQEMEEEEVLVEPVSSQMTSPTPPTRKPTKKPTKKPTRRPTKKPTHKPTFKPTRTPTKAPGTSVPTSKGQVTSKPTPKGTSKPTNKPTNKPTPRKIADMVEDVTTVLTEETTVELDMDACVRSARQRCVREVEAFNQSPFDRALMQSLNDCITANAAAIEAECMTAARTTTSMFSFSNMMSGDTEHPPCRHPEDLNSNLPVCEPKHKCRRGRMVHVIIGSLAGLITLFALVRLSLVCYRRRMAAGRVQERPAENGGAVYQPLKDNAAPVPSLV